MKHSESSINVIINPTSGTKSKDYVIKCLKKLSREYDFHFFYTEYPHHATEIALESVQRSVRYVIVVGGDGTINEVARALVGTDTVLGIIPHGSGNGLARHLHISMNISRAIDIFKQNKVQQIDYGIANGNLFFCTCGVGYDAEVSEKSLNQKKRGIMMYAKNMIDVFRNFKPESYRVTTSAGNFHGKAFTITCANASQYGNNAYIAPNADICDGKMNISILDPLSAVDIPRAALQMFTKRINDNPKLNELICCTASIERETDGVMHLDGNAIYTSKNINVEIIHKGLNVLVP